MVYNHSKRACERELLPTQRSDPYKIGILGNFIFFVPVTGRRNTVLDYCQIYSI